jgi:hypothetical protein
MSTSYPEPRSNPQLTVLQACVRSAGQKEHRGLVTGTQDDVTSVAFARGSAPYFPVAEEIMVTFRSQEVPKPFVARSRVILREDDNERLRYKLRLSECDAQVVTLLFKRRSSARVVPEVPLSIAVSSEQSAGVSLAARLRDVSIHGMSFYIEPAHEKQLYSANRLKVRVQLPGERERLDLVVEVRYRKLVDELIQFGLKIDWKQHAEAARVRETIQSYVLRRKREIMEQAALRSSTPDNL